MAAARRAIAETGAGRGRRGAPTLVSHGILYYAVRYQQGPSY